MLIGAILSFICALAGLYLCLVFLRRLRGETLSKPQAIRNSKRLIINSGLVAAAVYGVGLSIPDPASIPGSTWQVIYVYSRTVTQGAFWLVSVAFAGVGVNALSEALSRKPEKSDPEVESLINWLPKVIKDQLRA